MPAVDLTDGEPAQLVIHPRGTVDKLRIAPEGLGVFEVDPVLGAVGGAFGGVEGEDGVIMGWKWYGFNPFGMG